MIGYAFSRTFPKLCYSWLSPRFLSETNCFFFLSFFFLCCFKVAVLKAWLGNTLAPKTLSWGLRGQNYIIIILNDYMPFSLSFSHSCTVEYSRKYMRYDDILWWNMSAFEPVFYKLPMHGVTKSCINERSIQNARDFKKHVYLYSFIFFIATGLKENTTYRILVLHQRKWATIIWKE